MITIDGIQIFPSDLLAVSEFICIARSPSRARRRWRTGKRATCPFMHVPSRKVIFIGGIAYAHPKTIDAIRVMLSKQSDGTAARVGASLRAAALLHQVNKAHNDVHNAEVCIPK